MSIALQGARSGQDPPGMEVCRDSVEAEVLEEDNGQAQNALLGP